MTNDCISRIDATVQNYTGNGTSQVSVMQHVEHVIYAQLVVIEHENYGEKLQLNLVY